MSIPDLAPLVRVTVHRPDVTRGYDDAAEGLAVVFLATALLCTAGMFVSAVAADLTTPLLTAPTKHRVCAAVGHRWVNVGTPVRLGGAGTEHVHKWDGWRCKP